ncbi:MXAN_6640 family putative metalloprotease [Nocardioides sp. MAHUQ-72]|uniref:MXAN_6640 family putative metalloprotease n=1 Tax=unclassified Nocardioides TaxID=2615069 RepID=UPI0036164790
MRRSIAAAAAALATALSVLPATAATASDGALPPAASDPSPLARVQARQALERAQDVLSGSVQPAAGARPEGTLALRDLFAALPALAPADRAAAASVLARPTDGANDPYGDGYTVPAKRKCRGHICIHWVPTTADAPPSKAWVNKNLRTMNKVWNLEVGKLDYRRPVKDGQRGGNSKLDVYLKDVGSEFLYGYCAPEYYKPGRKREASGYCVLDNDFAQSQFGAPPVNSLKVTAAHEFFHAVQFAYDFKEDHWMMEATSTWMEERFADAVNDNRQYLSAGQVARPATPLDTFNPNGVEQYGNWVFFEYLSSRYGKGIVHKIWNRAGAYPGAGKEYSTQAVKGVLKPHGGFASVFARYAAGNTIPGRTYAEGGAWPSAAISKSFTLSKGARKDHTGLRVNHMASRNVALAPDSSLAGRKWRARIIVDGPNRAKSPVAYVVVKRKHGHPLKKVLHLSRRGHGKLAVPFSDGRVGRVTVTLANASTRFNCNENTYLSCQGKPKDNGSRFRVKVVAFKR